MLGVACAEAERAPDLACFAAGPHGIVPERELLIRDVAVVDDPIRARWDNDADPHSGQWHFGRLVAELGGADPGDAVEAWLETWLTAQVINAESIPARPHAQDFLDAWPRTRTGALRLDRAPFRLLAIVSRLDLVDEEAGIAGEGRLVFGAVAPDGAPLKFTVIFEYALPLAVMSSRDWAVAWHELSELDPGDALFQERLAELTGQFTDSAEDPPRQPMLLRVRTNENEFDDTWEFREFQPDHEGRLRPHPLANTPGQKYDASAALAGYINDNEARILARAGELPATVGGMPFMGGAIGNSVTDYWSAAGIRSNEARHTFALETCNGCHGAETGTTFLHISEREAGVASRLSAFLTGKQVHDPVDPTRRRSFARLDDRAAYVEHVLCDDDG